MIITAVMTLAVSAALSGGLTLAAFAVAALTAVFIGAATRLGDHVGERLYDWLKRPAVSDDEFVIRGRDFRNVITYTPDGYGPRSGYRRGGLLGGVKGFVKGALYQTVMAVPKLVGLTVMGVTTTVTAFSEVLFDYTPFKRTRLQGWLLRSDDLEKRSKKPGDLPDGETVYAQKLQHRRKQKERGIRAKAVNRSHQVVSISFIDIPEITVAQSRAIHQLAYNYGFLGKLNSKPQPLCLELELDDTEKPSEKTSEFKRDLAVLLGDPDKVKAVEVFLVHRYRKRLFETEMKHRFHPLSMAVPSVMTAAESDVIGQQIEYLIRIWNDPRVGDASKQNELPRFKEYEQLVLNLATVKTSDLTNVSSREECLREINIHRKTLFASLNGSQLQVVGDAIDRQLYFYELEEKGSIVNGRLNKQVKKTDFKHLTVVEVADDKVRSQVLEELQDEPQEPTLFTQGVVDVGMAKDDEVQGPADIEELPSDIEELPSTSLLLEVSSAKERPSGDKSLESSDPLEITDYTPPVPQDSPELQKVKAYVEAQLVIKQGKLDRKLAELKILQDEKLKKLQQIAKSYAKRGNSTSEFFVKVGLNFTIDLDQSNQIMTYFKIKNLFADTHKSVDESMLNEVVDKFFNSDSDEVQSAIKHHIKSQLTRLTVYTTLRDTGYVDHDGRPTIKLNQRELANLVRPQAKPTESETSSALQKPALLTYSQDDNLQYEEVLAEIKAELTLQMAHYQKQTAIELRRGRLHVHAFATLDGLTAEESEIVYGQLNAQGLVDFTGHVHTLQTNTRELSQILDSVMLADPASNLESDQQKNVRTHIQDTILQARFYQQLRKLGLADANGQLILPSGGSLSDYKNEILDKFQELDLSTEIIRTVGKQLEQDIRRVDPAFSIAGYLPHSTMVDSSTSRKLASKKTMGQQALRAGYGVSDSMPSVPITDSTMRGLVNVGSNCYANAAIQCLRSMPGIVELAASANDRLKAKMLDYKNQFNTPNIDVNMFSDDVKRRLESLDLNLTTPDDKFKNISSLEALYRELQTILHSIQVEDLKEMIKRQLIGPLMGVIDNLRYESLVSMVQLILNPETDPGTYIDVTNHLFHELNRQFSMTFSLTRQSDSEEYLSRLLEILGLSFTETQTLTVGDETTDVPISQTKIQIALPEGDSSSAGQLQELIDAQSASEEVDYQSTRAIKQNHYQIQDVPLGQGIPITLGRFSFNPETQRITKNSLRINGILSTDLTIEGHPIEITSIVLHKGPTTTSGHYVTVTKQPDGTWTLFNDSEVTTGIALSNLPIELSKPKLGFSIERDAYILMAQTKQVDLVPDSTSMSGSSFSSSSRPGTPVLALRDSGSDGSLPGAIDAV